MKDKKVFFKEKIVIALIWNLFYVAPISIMADVLTDDLISTICIIIFLYGILVFNSIKSWYVKEQLEYLNKKVNDLLENNNMM
jgi:hypothetical protein